MPGRFLISSNVSYYLNPPTCSSGNGTSTGQSQTGQLDIIEKKKKEDGTNYSMLQSPCKSKRTEPAVQAYDEILAAFPEIPSYGLARDDILKAYAILSSGNGHRVRSLFKTIPKNMRKDWLLMEIKLDDA